MNIVQEERQAQMRTTEKILPLENGDRLTRQEFERRYQAMPHLKKAELIEGVVYMGSPVRITHGNPHAHIMGWLFNYSLATPGVQVADNTTVRLDFDNEPQPDALLRIAREGQSTISEDGYLEGAPELIVEIATSSASYDLRDKLQVYRRNRCCEYLVWQVADRRFDWFQWQAGEYLTLSPDPEGIIRSQVFPGLWLSVEALLNGDLVEVRRVLEIGLATTEHATFLRQLSPG
ncbi:Uma2 family endonuclease [Oscillatoria salina]|uniref:Uma2 family endonuclease n=1 Tax=Oscillatoria salina TaxID=331517 RepID=UPI001CCD3321|nr:Uma2 family endonuclease [Oscillatoria salina]